MKTACGMAGRFLNVLTALVLMVHCQVSAKTTVHSGCQKHITNGINICEKRREDLQGLIKEVGKGLNTSHDERILLCHAQFDQIKAGRMYGCVLKEIFLFYIRVLNITKGRDLISLSRESSNDILHIILCMKKCVRKTGCKKLNEAIKRPIKKKSCHDSELTPKLVKLQIQKLWHARERLDDEKIQEKAIFELQNLGEYISKNWTKTYIKS
ncbi:uncharacterized protein LOC136771528 [Amia ocellicauda]|uniref:uncharacterized protein LOC136771528 n=1 Tax=Amia ocellicauda TaxID=2972642 RepID=UPI003463CF9C